MDQITTDERTADWVSIIKQCQNRPEGQTAKQWLEENGISSKKYYYWLRKIRNQVYNETIGSLPVENENNRILSPRLAYVELPPEEPKATVPRISIRTKKATIEISGVSDELAVKLVKAVENAI